MKNMGDGLGKADSQLLQSLVEGAGDVEDVDFFTTFFIASPLCLA